nr:MAG TPA: ATPase [Caudoviricetes sp.]
MSSFSRYINITLCLIMSLLRAFVSLRCKSKIRKRRRKTQ